MSRCPNIAIDGPAGSGKSTVARTLAKRLNYLYVDTGAMYRAVTYLALRASMDLTDRTALTALAEHTNFSLVRYLQDGSVTLWCNGENVTPFLRTMEVAQGVSLVAAIPGVRSRLVEAQRVLARSGGVVMEGRDIQTVVLPDAEYKFFLTAALETRLARRWQELQNQGQQVDLDRLRQDLIRRDRMDQEREVGPLKKAPDAITIDCTSRSVDEVVDQILLHCGGNR